MSGQLVVSFEGEDMLLEEGDSTYFDFGFPHSYCRRGRAVCSAIVVVTVNWVAAARLSSFL